MGVLGHTVGFILRLSVKGAFMTLKVFVDGQAGTTGLRLQDYLSARDDVTLLTIAPEHRKSAEARAEYLNAADVAFLCLPDVASREAAAMTGPDTCLIDASTAFRTQDDWVYGLPELIPEQRERLRQTMRIAVPGCHASAFLLLVRPLIDAGILPPDYPLSATSLTGYSGGGKSMIDTYEAGHDPRLDSPRPYALGLDHKHLPEMRVRGGLAHAPNFMPIVGPFLQGLTVSIPLSPALLPPGTTPDSLQALYARRYAGESFIQVMPLDAPDALDQGAFDVQACNGTNRVDLFVFGNRERILLMARLDNLGKGAAGAAIQCMNVRFGCPEDTGLHVRR